MACSPRLLSPLVGRLISKQEMDLELAGNKGEFNFKHVSQYVDVTGRSRGGGGDADAVKQTRKKERKPIREKERCTRSLVCSALRRSPREKRGKGRSACLSPEFST